MIGRYTRRQLFVHPIQYWFVVTTLMYFACMVIVLYGIVVLPMVETLDDPSVGWQEQAQAATQFLDFNARVCPWIAVTIPRPPAPFHVLHAPHSRSPVSL